MSNIKEFIGAHVLKDDMIKTVIDDATKLAGDSVSLELLLYDSGMSPDEAEAKVAEILNVVGKASEPHITKVREWMRDRKSVV